MKHRVILRSVVLLLWVGHAALAIAQSTAFTYQGQLSDNGVPATGIYDLRLTLYEAASSGNAVGGPMTNAAVVVSNGLFTTPLDFGAAVFNGAARWLEIGVRTNGGRAFVTLDPLQPLTAAPYAISAANLMNIGSDPLDIKVGGQRVLRLGPNATSPNLIGGFAGNVVSSGVAGAVIGGGGAATLEGTNGINRVTDNFGAVSGGGNNQAGNGNSDLNDARYATVGGGIGNTASGLGSTVGGGGNNLAGGISSTIAGGSGNRATNNDATVAGGFLNTAAYRATVAGGEGNTAGANHTFIGGGFQNLANEYLSTIGGGERNQIQAAADHSTIAGGGNNLVVGSFFLPVYGAIGGGQFNVIQTNVSYATISGGLQNIVQTNAGYGTIGGGQQNVIDLNATNSVIGGGENNRIGFGADHAGIGGGGGNLAGASFTSVAGGFANKALGSVSAISGGEGNTIETNGAFNVIDGGLSNRVGRWSFWNFVGGGSGNPIGSNVYYSVISGGNTNGMEAAASASVIGGGQNNHVLSNAFFSTIGGGVGNFVLRNARSSTIAGGESNTAEDQFATVAGGFQNDARAGYASISGGNLNFARGQFSVIAGGSNNVTDGAYSVISGGIAHRAGGDYATVAGGFANLANGPQSFAAGTHAWAQHRGAFVWADSRFIEPFTSIQDDEFAIRARGGVRISDETPSISFGTTTRQMLNLWSTNYGIGVQGNVQYYRSDGDFFWYRRGTHHDGYGNPGAGGQTLMRLDSSFLTVTSAGNELAYLGGDGVGAEVQVGSLNSGIPNIAFYNPTIADYMHAYAKSFNNASDRNAKENFTAVDKRDVLDKVTALPITTWNFRHDGTRHLGPMAQDFHAAFGVGPDDKHIATVDADGVALAAIQGLNQKLEEENRLLRDELNVRAADIDQLKRAVAELKELFSRKSSVDDPQR